MVHAVRRTTNDCQGDECGGVLTSNACNVLVRGQDVVLDRSAVDERHICGRDSGNECVYSEHRGRSIGRRDIGKPLDTELLSHVCGEKAGSGT